MTRVTKGMLEAENSDGRAQHGGVSLEDGHNRDADGNQHLELGSHTCTMLAPLESPEPAEIG